MNDSYSSIIISSDRLKVEVARPGSVYRRTRFDWTSFITQVLLDGNHTFCTSEDADPNKGTGGIGLCSEFGNEKAIGYADAKPGELFPKPGIGLLIRPEDPDYNFMQPYGIVQPFSIHIDHEKDFVRFTVDPLDCRGYAMREVKTIRAEGNCLSVAYQFENLGEKSLKTHEYSHNFIAINQQPVGPGYCLRLPYPVKFDDISESFRGMLPRRIRKIIPGWVLKGLVNQVMDSRVLQVDGQEIRWKFRPVKPFYCRLSGFSTTTEPQWELVYEPDGVGVRELDDFSPARVALWGAGHVISAEVFIDIDLQPGESAAWTRRYEFFKS